MSELTEREVAIFNAARGLVGSERAAYLDKACAGYAELRQRLDELLRVDEPAGDFLEKPAYCDTGATPLPGGTTPSSAALSEKPGDRIGRYKLLEQIGEGGCGMVYMAEQKEPVHRRVALKVIKLGMDTKQVIARFEAERQALALMDHPNIAKVLDAGATETGRPYFVMELVKGIPITRYCDENNLGTVTRLGLFVQVCYAVQHAHQKGIIHRDIKPSNILVADHDDVAVPKIIDFGIAKATTDQRLTDKTVFTAFEQFIGTPAYMSPEQAKLSGLDIDTRTDIYSLGVLLYELLTGKTPFEARRLLEAGLDEIRRVIREEEPVRPSMRLQTLDAEEQTTVAKLRQSDPPKLLHLIRGDLDWIVMKCLEKNRSRRYETAIGLASEVQRYLRGELVLAAPPSTLYRARKWVGTKRREIVIALAILAFALVGVAFALERARERGIRRAGELTALRLEESDILSRVIADQPMSALEDQSVQTILDRLAARVRSGSGSQADCELLARFMSRKFHVSGHYYQIIDSPTLSLTLDAPSEYLVKGVGLILRPFLTAEGTPVEVGGFPVYCTGGAGKMGARGAVRLERVKAEPGKWRFSCVLETQLVRDPEDNGAASTAKRVTRTVDQWLAGAAGKTGSKGAAMRTGVRVADYRVIGDPVRIALHPFERVFLRRLPEHYPVAVEEESQAKQIADGVTVSGGHLFIQGTKQYGCELTLGIPNLERAVPLALRLDLFRFGNREVQAWVQTLLLDHSMNWGVAEGEGVTVISSNVAPREQREQYHIRFLIPGLQAEPGEAPPDSIGISVRSAREAALREPDLDYYLSVPEIRRIVPVTTERNSNK